MRMQWVICDPDRKIWDGNHFVANAEYPKKYQGKGYALRTAKTLTKKFLKDCEVHPYLPTF